jgi:hypothetical protein
MAHPTVHTFDEVPPMIDFLFESTNVGNRFLITTKLNETEKHYFQQKTLSFREDPEFGNYHVKIALIFNKTTEQIFANIDFGIDNSKIFNLKTNPSVENDLETDIKDLFDKIFIMFSFMQLAFIIRMIREEIPNVESQIIPHCEESFTLLLMLKMNDIKLNLAHFMESNDHVKSGDICINLTQSMIRNRFIEKCDSTLKSDISSLMIRYDPDISWTLQYTNIASLIIRYFL